MTYNPYDLITLIINDMEIYGRPFEFDSEVVDQIEMTNSEGNLVKPTKLSTICPDCGQGLEIEVELNGPPFGAVETICPYCNPEPEPIPDPFINPLDTGRIEAHNLDPLLYDLDSKQSDDGLTVAERMATKASPVPSEDPEEDEAKEPDEPSKVQEEAKEKSEELKEKQSSKKEVKEIETVPPQSINPNAELMADMGEEVDFDDDLVEKE